MNFFEKLTTEIFYGTFADLPRTYHELKPEDPNWQMHDYLRIDNRICSDPFDRMIIFKTDYHVYLFIHKNDWNDEDTLKLEKITEEVVANIVQDFDYSPSDLDCEAIILDSKKE